MDVESVRSGRSARSERSDRSHSSSRANRRNHSGRHGSSRERSHNRHYDKEERDHETETDKDDRSVSVKMSSNHHRSHSEKSDRNREEFSETGERIEVQIYPQDDIWPDNTTCITGNTSETAFSMDDMSRLTKDMEDSIGFNCARYIGSLFAGIICLLSFLSPIAMVLLPKLGLQKWTQKPCGPECEGLFISFSTKLVILLIGAWALFFRRPKATMPRIFIFRAFILFLIFIVTFAFWLFYGVRIWQTTEENYHSIVLYAASLVDALLFLHYLAVILIELRQIRAQYVVKLVRSPDGHTQSYTVGQLSIQRLAVFCLEQYYTDFQVYNPYLENVSRRPKLSGFKVYDIDGSQNQTMQSRSRAIFAAAARRRDTGHNDRFYEEQDYERRVHKRKARLITAAEEAFTHVKRLLEDKGPAIPMDPMEAAQAIFPSMARALQKFLRITRQQPRYTMDNILQHLATCLSHDMTAKGFLERYMTQGPVVWNDKDYRSTQTWVLICDQLLSRAVEDGTLFQLRQGDVSVLVTVRRLPHFNLTEEVIHPKNNKFVLRMNSETSV